MNNAFKLIEHKVFPWWCSVFTIYIWPDFSQLIPRWRSLWSCAFWLAIMLWLCRSFPAMASTNNWQTRLVSSYITTRLIGSIIRIVLGFKEKRRCLWKHLLALPDWSTVHDTTKCPNKNHAMDQVEKHWKQQHSKRSPKTAGNDPWYLIHGLGPKKIFHTQLTQITMHQLLNI